MLDGFNVKIVVVASFGCDYPIVLAWFKRVDVLVLDFKLCFAVQLLCASASAVLNA